VDTMACVPRGKVAMVLS